MGLNVHNLTFTYPDSSLPALQRVSFSVQKGEAVAIIGPNGSGKTTLGYALCGIIPRLLPGDCEGRIEIENKSLEDLALTEVSQLIGYTFQDPESQFVTLRVRDELMIGPELTTQEVELLTSFDLNGLLDRDPAALSMGQKQRVALASLFLKNCGVLVLDEPSASLDLDARKKLILLLKAHKGDHATVFFTHDLDLVPQLADRVIGLAKGTVQFDKPSVEVGRDDIENLFGLQDWRFPPVCPLGITRSNFQLSAEAKRVSFGFKRAKELAVTDVSLRVSANWGLVGSNGSGKTTMLLLLAGLLEPTRGSIERNFSLLERKRLERTKPRVTVVFQNPNHQTFASTIYDELAFALRNLGHDEEVVRRKIEAIATSFGIEELERDPHTLSFGWRKIVSFAGALVVSPSLLILDEPEAGLDPFFTALVTKVLKSFSEQGGKIVVASHDPMFLQEHVSSVSFMDKGRLAWSGGVDRAVMHLKERYENASR